MKQKLLFGALNCLIALGLVFSVFMTVAYGMLMSSAGSPDCGKGTNSSLVCEPSHYLPSLFMWGVASALLIALAIVFTSVQIKKPKKK